MVKHISDRIGVMHNGLLLEMGTSDEIYNHGVHPYTESLLSAIPLPDPDHERKRRRIKYPLNQMTDKYVNFVKSHQNILSMQLSRKSHITQKTKTTKGISSGC